MGRKGKKTTLLSLLVIGVLIIAGGSGGYIYVGSNNFCGYKCHQMKTRAAIWQKSSHSEVKCITCHSEPGFIGEIKAHIDGLNYLKSFVKGKTENITIFATERNPARLKSCLFCHPAEKLKDETEAIRIFHYKHVIKTDILCTDCHEDAIHGTHSFETVMIRPQEKNCLACHFRLGAPTNCESCHIKQVIRGRRQVYMLDALEDIGIKPEPDH